MKKNDTLVEYFICRYSELDALEVYLEEKAAQGWILEERTDQLCTFRRVEPRVVQVWADVVIPDDEANNDQWEDRGWKEILNDGKIRIFENENLRANPVEPDQQKRLKEIHRRSKWPLLFWPIIGAIIFGGLMVLMEPFGAWVLSSLQTMGLAVYIPVMLMVFLSTPITYLLWYKKAKEQAASGKPFSSKKRRPWAMLDACWGLYFVALVGGGLLDWLYIKNVKFCCFTFGMMIVILLLGMVLALLKRKQTERKWRWVPLVLIGLIICFNVGAGFYTAQNGIWWKYDETEIPLSMEDLDADAGDSDERWADYAATPWLEEWNYGDDVGDEEYLYYTIYTTKHVSIFDRLLRREYLDTKWYDFREVQDDAFQADRVWFDEEANDWLLTKGKQIILLDSTLILNEEQKQIVAEKLISER